jgi:fucose 4-O-acetylase-like acetyltransferase
VHTIRQLAIALILLTVAFACVYLIFTAWTDAFYNEDRGLDKILNEQAQKTMSGENLDNWNTGRGEKNFFWNLTFLFVVFIIFLLAIIYVLKRNRIGGNE